MAGMAGSVQSRTLIISYSRRDGPRVHALAEALVRVGVQVWIDRDSIDPLGDVPARIREGLAGPHALLAWYSNDYAQSGSCRKESIAAWIAAHQQSKGVLSRILIVNPERSLAHIALGDLSTLVRSLGLFGSGGEPQHYGEFIQLLILLSSSATRNRLLLGRYAASEGWENAHRN